MAGLGAAVGLAKAGCRVLVVSKKLKGESSPAAGGILDPFLEMSPGHPLFKISREAFRRYPALVRHLENAVSQSIGYRKTGMLFAAMNQAELQELKRRFAWQRKTGLPVKWLSREAVLRKDPATNPEVLAGLYYPTVARIHPDKMVRVLKLYARSLGVRFLVSSEDAKIFYAGRKAAGILLAGRRIEADAVVNATGAWASAGGIGKKLPVSPAKGQIVLVRSGCKISTILHSLDGGYIVPWNDTPMRGNQYEYLLGSTVEKVGFSPKSTQEGIRKIMLKNTRILPALAESRKIRAWAGLRPFSKTRMPLIGPTRTPGLYLAAGYYRSGILIGCYAGELLAETIVSGSIPAVIRPFDPRKYSL